MWKSKKQNVVARSSVEAGYRAIAKATTELIWMKLLLEEFGFPITDPMKLWCNNQAVIHIANNLVFHKRTKHIELDSHYIRDKVKDKVINLSHVKYEQQFADILTKALSIVRHHYLQSKLRMVDHPI